MAAVRMLPSISHVRAMVFLHVATVWMLCCMVAQPLVVLCAVFLTLMHFMLHASLSDVYFDPTAWIVVHGGLVSGVLTESAGVRSSVACIPLARMCHCYVFRIIWDHGSPQTLCICRDALPPAAFSQLAMRWWEQCA